MTLVLDRVGRLLRGDARNADAECIVCRRPIGRGDSRMTVRGSVQVHRVCATYRMRQLESGAGRRGHPPR